MRYDERVLTPRAWTQAQSEWAAALSGELPDGAILELCSGAGHIGLLTLALTHRTGRGRRLVCVDRNPAAAELTKVNADAAGLVSYVEVRCDDLGSALRPEERYPLVIADPPWVARADVARFPGDPVPAIDGGVDGLEVARRCIRVIETHLAPGGAAILQLGYAEQVDGLTAALKASQLEVVEVRVEQRGVLVQLAGA